MENEKKNNGTLVGILIGIVLTLLVVGGLFVTGTIGFKTNTTTDNGQDNLVTENNSNNVDTKDVAMEYSYDKVAGYYEAKINEKDEGAIEGDSGVTTYSLYLYENGTFSFRWAHMASAGFIGNYIIKNNTIILNPIYDTNSGAEKTKTVNKPTVLTINQDETLETDGDTFKKITLTKSTGDSSQNWFDHYLKYEGN